MSPHPAGDFLPKIHSLRGKAFFRVNSAHARKRLISTHHVALVGGASKDYPNHTSVRYTSELWSTRRKSLDEDSRTTPAWNGSLLIPTIQYGYEYVVVA
jgi:hypothetical protein